MSSKKILLCHLFVPLLNYQLSLSCWGDAVDWSQYWWMVSAIVGTHLGRATMFCCFAYPFDVFAARAWSFSNSSRQHWDKTRRSFHGHIDESIYHCHISFLAILAPNSNSSRLISKVLGKSRFQLDAVTLTCRHEGKAKELFAGMQNSEYLQRIGHGKRYDCCFLIFFFWQKNANKQWSRSGSSCHGASRKRTKWLILHKGFMSCFPLPVQICKL